MSRAASIGPGARRIRIFHGGMLAGMLLLTGLIGCGADLLTTDELDRGPGFAFCDLNPDFLWAQLGRDEVISLEDPEWVRADQSIPSYLDPDTRIIGIVSLGQAWAVPHNVLWHHEIANFSPGGPVEVQLAATYCPLTGSSLVFDRRSIGGATLGVSGIVHMNNLVMFDRQDPEDSLWPQMMAEARCGSRTGTPLAQYAFVEMQWAEWLDLHPSTHVLAGAEEQGFDPNFFDYSALGYPYGNYEEIPQYFIAGLMPPLDERRFSKERVIGLPSRDGMAGDPGIAFPFGALEEEEGAFQVVEFSYEGEAAVVLWSDRAQGGTAFRPVTQDGTAVSLRTTASGFEDVETGSTWTVDGRATAGQLAGNVLVPIEGAYVAFWGAWWAHHPETRLWEG